ncbi:glutamine synthetase [Clostridium luticellarii]|jgi:glutamine synthetase|uniref:glutamine synthetase n=1 Tax=Clostridium luticellarii TaxID=1691940 RepID=A0A2T0BP16_9CLOT|nr:glutamine synthetase [Clostridium luticellarii]MCI1944620.1 glutamine synthetase [Clostridium luticellarii]MCI1968119.1 glutamine synthetase [Clostridium luticellarii]MCI1994768.1 glutamine synthetase [Clostridium luticellarii]MCI2039000.1 glutamine synthetase [Clostridium luticellarii]PRR85624.1 Glutamine synthetase 1 [Clostridium luticellarii]
MLKDLIYIVPKEKHSEENLKEILTSHPEIKFVSLIGIDLSGNDTDEKIPIKVLLDDITAFLKGAIQTDGSSVVLPGIASLNNAKVDMVCDLDVNWYVEYNTDNVDPETEKPVGTLRIPCFLYHENKAVDSRYTLTNCIEHFKADLLNLFKEHPDSLTPFGIKYDDIDSVAATCATELEFWVKTPNNQAEIEELSTSQVLQEQYWTRTKGVVRTALEQTILNMELYGLEPEMGHKEVGGVKAKIDESGNFNHIAEQLEIDWKYSSAIQAADNELLVKSIVKETFRQNGLEVTFLAKPIDGVAGSGEHTHIGLALKLKNNKTINLFSSTKQHFLSVFGYSSVMGILKNYEVINPFVSSTTDALRRLKPGFEAPICIVTSVGHAVDLPSRNRTVLIGVVRDLASPLSTRFELRAPNPRTNTYLALTALYISMMDGITYALKNNKNEDDLLTELSKKPGEDADYLEKERAYRSEENIFEDFTDEEREKFFGKAPATVYENLSAFDKYPKKKAILVKNDILNDKLINSFKLGAIKRWLVEINHRIINEFTDEIRSYKILHSIDKALDLDVANWMKIEELKYYLMKDSYSKKSLFSRIRIASENKDYEEVSKLQVEAEERMSELRSLYSTYKKNLLDI